MGKTLIRTYSELVGFSTFEERFAYLKLDGVIGIETFGFDRYLNQALYNSSVWKDIVRRDVIFRDEGNDLGLPDYPIFGSIVVHHMNPITADDIVEHNPDVFNPEFLICVSRQTHKALHYGDIGSLNLFETERTANDTCPWKQQ